MATKTQAKKTTKRTGETGRQAAGHMLTLATEVVKGKSKGMSANDIALAVCEKDSTLKPFNVAFVVRQAARKGEVFTRTEDRPALYKLKPAGRGAAAKAEPAAEAPVADAKVEVTPDPKPAPRKRAKKTSTEIAVPDAPVEPTVVADAPAEAEVAGEPVA